MELSLKYCIYISKYRYEDEEKFEIQNEEIEKS